MNQDRKKFLEELKKFWIKENIPNLSEVNAKFLSFLIDISWAKNVLEIWCANWYSTIWIANTLEKNWWKLKTYDVSLPSFEDAKKNIKAVWLDQIVDFNFWNFLEMEVKNEKWEEEIFDFIFIDARKKYSLDFLLKVRKNSKPWTIIFIDDVIKFRSKMENLYEYIDWDQDEFEHFVLPIHDEEILDWVMILKKK